MAAVGLESLGVLAVVVDQEGIAAGEEMLTGRDGILPVHPLREVVVNPLQLAGQTLGAFRRAGGDADVSRPTASAHSSNSQEKKSDSGTLTQIERGMDAQSVAGV